MFVRSILVLGMLAGSSSLVWAQAGPLSGDDSGSAAANCSEAAGAGDAGPTPRKHAPASSGSFLIIMLLGVGLLVVFGLGMLVGYFIGKGKAGNETLHYP